MNLPAFAPATGTPFLITLLGACLLSACASKPPVAPEEPFEALAGHSYFMQYVRPILETNCLSCHQGAHPPAGLSLVQRSGAYAPRRRGRAFIVPGDPERSLLYTAITPGGSHPRTLPLATAGLTDYDIGALHEWIEDGAHWPDNPEGFLQPRYPIANP